MMPAHPVPMIPGWNVHRDGPMLVAYRAMGLTEYMRTYGALLEIRAHDYGELWILCDAQTRLAERLATAEWLRPEMRQRLAQNTARDRDEAAAGAVTREGAAPVRPPGAAHRT